MRYSEAMYLLDILMGVSVRPQPSLETCDGALRYDVYVRMFVFLSIVCTSRSSSFSLFDIIRHCDFFIFRRLCAENDSDKLQFLSYLCSQVERDPRPIVADNRRSGILDELGDGARS